MENNTDRELMAIANSLGEEFFNVAEFVVHKCVHQPEKMNVGVIGPPKTATRFLYQSLSMLLDVKEVVNITNYNDHDPAYNNFYELHEIDVTKTLSLLIRDGRFIFHGHYCANAHTIKLLELLGISPIVSVRNITDSLVSLIEELEKQWTREQYYLSVQRYGFANNFGFRIPIYAVDKFLSSDTEERLNFVISNFGAWYFWYYSSWKIYQNLKIGKVFFAYYDDLISSETRLLSDIMDFLGDYTDEEAISSVVKNIRGNKDLSASVNLNVGILGRGKSMLSKIQVERLKEIGSNVVDPPTVQALLFDAGRIF